MKFTCLIVDDEKDAREGLSLLVQQDESIRILGVCGDGVSAITQINQLNPDLLFLDVQMPQIDGFEVLRSVDHLPKAVVFVTAHDEYALKAFEVHAIDYLLKPFTDNRFFQALEHAKKRMLESSMHQKQGTLIHSLTPHGSMPDHLIKKNDTERLIIKSGGRVHLIPYYEIIWLEAFDYYVKIHVSNKFHLLRESMKTLESRLADYGFVRIHKSSIVNISRIRRFSQQGSKDFLLQLENGVELKVSRNYKKRLFEVIKEKKA